MNSVMSLVTRSVRIQAMSSGPPGDRPRSYVVLALLCMSIGILGCAAAQRGDRDGTSHARVLVQSNVADAELWVDERFVAQVGTLRNGIALSPGEHRIELRHDKYHTHYSELSVAPGEQRTLRVELAEILP